jgi:hypothetical protein
LVVQTGKFQRTCALSHACAAGDLKSEHAQNLLQQIYDLVIFGRHAYVSFRDARWLAFLAAFMCFVIRLTRFMSQPMICRIA